MRRLHTFGIALSLIFVLVGWQVLRPETTSDPVSQQVQATQTVPVRPTITPYLRSQQPASPPTVERRETGPTRQPAVAATRYQVNTLRLPDGSPAAMILRSLDSLSVGDLVGDSSLTPILAYYHSDAGSLARLIASCNGLHSDALAAGQVILIPLNDAGAGMCPPDPALAQRYLPLEAQAFEGQTAQSDERMLVYFTQAGETLNTLARRFESTVERLRELNAGLEVVSPDLPLQVDTLVYVRIPARYDYTPPTVVAPAPSKAAILVFTQASGQAAPPPVAAAAPPADAVAAAPTPTPEPAPTAAAAAPPADPIAAAPTSTPEPAPTATAPDASPTPVSVVVLMNPVLAPTATPEPVAEEPPLYDPRHILDSYAEFLSGGSFSSKTIIATTQVANGESITVDGDAALKYLTKQNVFIGGAVNVAVRTLIRGSSLEFPAVGFYGIPAGTKLDIAAANAAAGEKGFVVLDQQAFRQDDDPLSKTMMLAYDQLLKERPNLQFLVLLSHGADGKIRAVAYLYEAVSPQESMTLSGAPLNFDGCPPDVQLVMMAATYDWDRQTVEFH